MQLTTFVFVSLFIYIILWCCINLKQLFKKGEMR